MKLQYFATIDELTDEHVRAFKRLKKTSKRLKWKGAIASGLLSALLLFFIIPNPMELRLIVGIIGLFGGAVTCWLLYPQSIYRSIRRVIKEKCGNSDGAHFEIELRQTGIWTRTNNTQIEFPWANFSSIHEEPTLLEFNMLDGNLVVVHKRAFEDKKQIDIFLQTAIKLRDTYWSQNQIILLLK